MIFSFTTSHHISFNTFAPGDIPGVTEIPMLPVKCMVVQIFVDICGVSDSQCMFFRGHFSYVCIYVRTYVCRCLFRIAECTELKTKAVTRQATTQNWSNWIRGCPSLGIRGGQLGEPGAATGGTQPHCPGSLVLSR